jgi:Bacteriophage replication gene A protein (GPA)
MPVIQQQIFIDQVNGEPVERRVSVVAGLPERWGRRAYSELMAALKKHGAASEQYRDLCGLLDSITAAPIPVDATDAHLCVMAERYAADCANVPVAEMAQYWPTGAGLPGDGVGPRQYAERAPVQDERWARERMAGICQLRGIEAPADKCEDDEAIKRMIDPAWWRARLRRVHGRAFEHAAMRLGFVSIRAGSYCSDETADRRAQQIARNNAALQATMLKNDQGQEFSLYDLSQKGIANKSNRKGELMLRMAGCEAVAKEYDHVGLFVTGTCPGRFHAVLHKTGTANPKYAEAGSRTPRQAQEWLNTAWQRTRAQNDRDGIAPYGFRIAEPHHDGTPHWHMLVFMPAKDVETFKRNMSIHWLADGADEVAHDPSIRIKFVKIDPAKGTAAGYIAKYVSKNIDDQVAHQDEEGVVESATPACARVDAWAAVWGIRQFQGLGMPPVTVWRELRRVKEDNDQAPAYVLRALLASRRLEGAGPTQDGKPLIVKPADFAEYIRAQGGVHLGRKYLVRIAAHEGIVQPGRYGEIVVSLPFGIYGATAPAVVCESTRYSWTRAGRKGARSPLNNCTQGNDQDAAKPWPGRPSRDADWCSDMVFVESEAPDEYSDWWESDEFRKYSVDAVSAAWNMLDAEAAAGEVRASTSWTPPSYPAGELERIAGRARAARRAAEREAARKQHKQQHTHKQG